MPFENKEGQNVPDVTFMIRRNNQLLPVTTDEIFKGKTVVAFSLPGAYTPTCSSSHVPHYEQLTETFKQNGVDDVVCFSVNDGFVMEAWQKELDAPSVTFIADGNGDFTKGMGLLVDKSDIGFGPRSWRYSMLVRDKKIVKMFIEPEKPGDPFEVSDARTMLNYINPKAELPHFVTVFAREGCPHCIAAKALLKERGIKFEVINTGAGSGLTARTLEAVCGRSTVPQIFIGSKHIGGREDLEKYFA
ncbi:Redoxin [Carpediemonas membranifera]|uniref:Redoxin n=1 Tax=Carpediemonas membranifera TaxID=201153 RepID=A0A8J6APJ4_9EUKA|nr:Redoxin [Carpediemonas membranifera]|eukprot:KAG9389548.1 Redoxin [Carpediemonas membranifera]